MVDEELERIRMRKMAEMMSRKTPAATGLAEPVILSDVDFDQFVSSNPVVLVDFWAEWCGPCRVIGPVIRQMAQDYAGKVAFGKLNVDENPMIAERFGINSIPTMLIFRSGQLADGIVGAVPRSIIEARLAKHLPHS